VACVNPACGQVGMAPTAAYTNGSCRSSAVKGAARALGRTPDLQEHMLEMSTWHSIPQGLPTYLISIPLCTRIPSSWYSWAPYACPHKVSRPVATPSTLQPAKERAAQGKAV
jgi:hypothetical protein